MSLVSSGDGVHLCVDPAVPAGPPRRRCWAIGIVVRLSVDGREQGILAAGRADLEERPVRPVRTQRPFEVGGRRRVDGRVRFDVVALGDHGRGVAEEGGGGIRSDTAGNDGGCGAAIPPHSDAGVVESGQRQEVAECAPDVVRTQRPAGAVGEDRPLAISRFELLESPAQYRGRELRHRNRRIDASDLGRSWRRTPLPFRWTTVPLTCTTMPAGPSETSQIRSPSTSPVRMAVPSRTSTTSRTWPSDFGPGRPGSLRQAAAAARIAATCSSVSA